LWKKLLTADKRRIKIIIEIMIFNFFFILSIIFAFVSDISMSFRLLKIEKYCNSEYSIASNKISSLGEIERRDLWKNVSNLEKKAIEMLGKNTNPTEVDKDEALKLLAKSFAVKSTDPFVQLAHEYNIAIDRHDKIEADRVLQLMKTVGLPPHISAVISKPQPTSVNNPMDLVEAVITEEVDAGSAFSDTVTEKIRVKVSAYYDPSKSDPNNGKYMFWYKVAIFNEGAEPVQVVARMWEVEKCRGEKEVVRGAGILGTQPIIAPGDVYNYESLCPLKVFPPKGKRILGSLSGAYTMCRGNMGQHNFTVKVSKLNLILPEPVA
jgi:ApaG protein